MKNLNKICATADWSDPELSEMMQEILQPGIKKAAEIVGRHRKHWEWAIGMLALKKAGKIDNNCTFLGIGSGTEAPVFYLTNHAKYVFCTDLYTITSETWKEANKSMLANPELFAPGQFNRKRLGVQIMSGTDIHFEDNTFDAIFSYSSIEHFGTRKAVLECMKEIERVLKPGGVASIATEIFVGTESEKLYRYRKKDSQFPYNLLRGHYKIFSEIFTRDELDRYLLSSTNMKLLYPIDFSIDLNDLAGAVKFPVTKEYNYDQNITHIFLDMNGMLWGSIHISLIKQLT
jgi:SAM-dependent methyltransferase